MINIDYEKLIEKVKSIHHPDIAHLFDFIYKNITSCNTEQTLKIMIILHDLDIGMEKMMEELCNKPVGKSQCYAETILNAVALSRYCRIDIQGLINEKKISKTS